MEFLGFAPNTLVYHCPFNPSHTMKKKTLTKHITRCSDRPANYKSCIYHMSHVMPAAELEAHEQNCPNRILFDTAVYESEDLVRPLPVVENVPNIEYEESWDNIDRSADVLKNITKKAIPMKAVHGSTKSERKIHRNVLHKHDVLSDNNKQKKRGKKHRRNSIAEHKSETELFVRKRPPMHF